MPKTITLSETAVKLLSEFRDADVKFEWAKSKLSSATSTDEQDAADIKAFHRTLEARKTAACVFAACVAEVVYKEVTNG